MRRRRRRNLSRNKKIGLALVSVAAVGGATALFVTVKSAVASAASEAELVVMVPLMVLRVTPVVRLVAWVTAPPAPVL